MERMQILGKNPHNIKFTMQCDPNKIPFLDVKLYIQEGGFLTTNLYRNPTSGDTILYEQSAHPDAFMCILYGQYIPLRRSSSWLEDFINLAVQMRQRLFGSTDFFFKKLKVPIKWKS